MMIEKIEERLTEVRSEIEQTKDLLKQMEAGTLTLHEAKGSATMVDVTERRIAESRREIELLTEFEKLLESQRTQVSGS
jgi:hypothetical protein